MLVVLLPMADVLLLIAATASSIAEVCPSIAVSNSSSVVSTSCPSKINPGILNPLVEVYVEPDNVRSRPN